MSTSLDDHVAFPHTVGVLGGTGAQGRGLALRWARAGHIRGTDNATCAAHADIVLAAVP